MWAALLLTVLAAAGNNIGKVLQKQGTKGLPQLTLDSKVLYLYITNVTWTLGMLIDVGGAFLMIEAVARAPVSVVQPVSGCGLAILAVFSHFYLQESMQTKDWVAVVLAAVGTIGIGLSAEGQANTQFSLLRLFLMVLVLILFLGGLDVWIQGDKHRRRHESNSSPLSPAHPDVGAELTAGMQAGACFGLSAAVCRTGFMLAQGGLWLCIPGGIGGSIALSSTGFFCQTRGLKDGRAVVVSTCAAVAAILTGVLVGLFALGEQLPRSFWGRLLMLCSWAAIVIGVVLLLQAGQPSLPRSLRSMYRRMVRRVRSPTLAHHKIRTRSLSMPAPTEVKVISTAEGGSPPSMLPKLAASRQHQT